MNNRLVIVAVVVLLRNHHRHRHHDYELSWMLGYHRIGLQNICPPSSPIRFISQSLEVGWMTTED